jgi:hypothetical protein
MTYVAKKYLEPGDPGSFLGLSPRKKEDMPEWWPGGEVCPTCRGYGGWHLHVDAYGPGKHFDAACNSCWGYGFLREGQSCAHEWDVKGAGKWNCTSVWKCKKCGAETEIDSSD